MVRLAELLHVSAGVLRDLLGVRNSDGESDNLVVAADDLERLAHKVAAVGRSGLPLPP